MFKSVILYDTKGTLYRFYLHFASNRIFLVVHNQIEPKMNLKFPPLTFVFVVLLMFSCDSSSDSEEDPVLQTDDDEVVNVDESNPIINVEGLGDVVESKRTITVSLQDESSVLTKIEVNGEEVFESSQKNFEFVLNPYTIPIGENIIRILAEDDFENSTELIFLVDIRHLLMEFNLGAHEVANNTVVWTFFNDLEGNLIESFKPQVGSNKIYTSKILVNTEFYYTISKLSSLGTIIVEKTLTNTTFRTTLGETRNQASEPTSFSLNETIDLQIVTIEPTTDLQKYDAIGSKYSTIGSGSDGNIEDLLIKYSDPTPFYVRTSLSGGGIQFNGKKENYRYFRISPGFFPGNMSISEFDFRRMNDESVPIDIPPHDLGSLSFFRYGFENDNDLLNDVYHRIYDVSESSDNNITDYVDLPRLDGLEHYSNTIRYMYDDKRLTINQFGDNLDLSMPSWELDFGLLEDTLYVEGNNAEVDYYVIRLSKNQNTAGIIRTMRWDYRTFGGEDSQKSTPLLDFPNEITQNISDDFFNNDGLVLSYGFAIDFENLDSYSQSVDYLGLRKISLSKENQNNKSLRYNPN